MAIWLCFIWMLGACPNYLNEGQLLQAQPISPQRNHTFLVWGVRKRIIYHLWQYAMVTSVGGDKGYHSDHLSVTRRGLMASERGLKARPVTYWLCGFRSTAEGDGHFWKPAMLLHFYSTTQLHITVLPGYFWFDMQSWTTDIAMTWFMHFLS